MIGPRTGSLKIVKQEHGQSFAELMLILPVLLLLMAAVLDVGRSLQAYVTLLNASREAAILGASAQTDGGVLSALVADELERGGLDPSLATTTVLYQTSGFPPENHIIVQVDYTLPLLMSVLAIPNLQLSVDTEMVAYWQ